MRNKGKRIGVGILAVAALAIVTATLMGNLKINLCFSRQRPQLYFDVVDSNDYRPAGTWRIADLETDDANGMLLRMAGLSLQIGRGVLPKL